MKTGGVVGSVQFSLHTTTGCSSLPVVNLEASMSLPGRPTVDLKWTGHRRSLMLPKPQ